MGDTGKKKKTKRENEKKKKKKKEEEEEEEEEERDVIIPRMQWKDTVKTVYTAGESGAMLPENLDTGALSGVANANLM
nr:unnamed protein product [Spirometra erinaceieuropaei]